VLLYFIIIPFSNINNAFSYSVADGYYNINFASMGTTDNFVGEIAGVTMYPKTLSASEIIAIRDDCEGVGVDTIGILTAVNFTSLLVLNMF